MMLTRLYALLGKQSARVMHRYLILMLIFCLVQGFASLWWCQSCRICYKVTPITRRCG